MKLCYVYICMASMIHHKTCFACLLMIESEKNVIFNALLRRISFNCNFITTSFHSWCYEECLQKQTCSSSPGFGKHGLVLGWTCLAKGIPELLYCVISLLTNAWLLTVLTCGPDVTHAGGAQQRWRLKACVYSSKLRETSQAQMAPGSKTTKCFKGARGIKST